MSATTDFSQDLFQSNLRRILLNQHPTFIFSCFFFSFSFYHLSSSSPSASHRGVEISKMNPIQVEELKHKLLALQHTAIGDAAVATTHTDQEHDSCIFCLETVSGPCELIPCGHRNFDFTCIMPWLFKHSPTCPLCKVPVTSVLHGPRGTEFRREFKIDKTQPLRQSFQPQEPPPRVVQRPGRLRNTLNLEHRRRVYREGLFAMHVGSNRWSRYRELTAKLFNEDPHLVSRARMFLRRELQVFDFLSREDPQLAPASQHAMPPPGERLAPNQRWPSSVNNSVSANASTGSMRKTYNREFLIEYIVCMLKSVDIMGNTAAAHDMLSDFLGREHSRQFLHELRAWLRSPYETLEEWDANVQYRPVTGSRRTEPSAQLLNSAAELQPRQA